MHAAMQYKAAGVPLVVLGGREYGTGSSRDWAAKGTNLLGVLPAWGYPELCASQHYCFG